MLAHSKIKRLAPSRVEGFTLVEVTVSIAIMALVLTVVLSGQSTFTEGAAIRGAADEMELSIRQAQVYGVGVREVTAGSVEFNVSYGLSFDITSSGSNDAYIYFIDRGVQNKIYDSGWSCPIGGSSECSSKTLLNRGNTISSMCYTRTNGVETCSVRRFDLTFTRPDTKANMKFFDASGNQIFVGDLKSARVKLVSPSGIERSVVVYTTGQVSVQ